MKAAIIDCGIGNLRSVKNALDHLKVDCAITFDKKVIKKADLVIFPGQGHFGTIMQQLIERDLLEIVRESAKTKPYLGICVGMQILFESSEEALDICGLGIFKGTVRKFPSFQKIPQIGWNWVQFTKTGFQYDLESDHFYFANSYYCEVKDRSFISGISHYGIHFPSAIRKDHLMAVQFHPEKSGKKGLKFLENYLNKIN